MNWLRIAITLAGLMCSGWAVYQVLAPHPSIQPRPVTVVEQLAPEPAAAPGG